MKKNKKILQEVKENDISVAPLIAGYEAKLRFLKEELRLLVWGLDQRKTSSIDEGVEEKIRYLYKSIKSPSKDFLAMEKTELESVLLEQKIVIEKLKKVFDDFCFTIPHSLDYDLLILSTQKIKKMEIIAQTSLVRYKENLIEVIRKEVCKQCLATKDVNEDYCKLLKVLDKIEGETDFYDPTFPEVEENYD